MRPPSLPCFYSKWKYFPHVTFRPVRGSADRHLFQKYLLWGDMSFPCLGYWNRRDPGRRVILPYLKQIGKSPPERLTNAVNTHSECRISTGRNSALNRLRGSMLLACGEADRAVIEESRKTVSFAIAL